MLVTTADEEDDLVLKAELEYVALVEEDGDERAEDDSIDEAVTDAVVCTVADDIVLKVAVTVCFADQDKREV